MSEEEQEEWASEEDTEDEEDEEDTGDGALEHGDDEQGRKKPAKRQLTFCEFWQLPGLLVACGGSERRCLSALRFLAQQGGQRFEDVAALSLALGQCKDAEGLAAAVGAGNAESEGVAEDEDEGVEQEETMALLNLMYAPRHSRLHSMAKTLARLDNLSHILAWTSCPPEGPAPCSGFDSGAECKSERDQRRAEAQWHAARGCPPLELVELPRLKLSFTARADEDGELRLFSLDHANLFVSNTRDPRALKLIAGIPHSLLMSTAQGEVSVLVSVWKLARPRVKTHPFTTSLVEHHAHADWNAAQDQHYFLYPIHVSMSFIMTRGLASAMYLLLLRLLHRDYASAFRLAESVASDSRFEPAAKHIWADLALANDDFHPDAQACRQKLALVTVDSGEGTPWDLTDNQSRLTVKLEHVSSECRVSRHALGCSKRVGSARIIRGALEHGFAISIQMRGFKVTSSFLNAWF